MIKAIGGGATGNLKLQFNDADTNLYSFRIQQTAADSQVVTHSTSTTLFSIGPQAADNATGWMTIRSKTGYTNRTGDIVCFTGNGPSAERTCFTYSDTSTNIIKLSIVAANATSLDVGSFMTATKLHHQY